MVRSVCVFNKTVSWLEEHPNKSSFISQALRLVKTYCQQHPSPTSISSYLKSIFVGKEMLTEEVYWTRSKESRIWNVHFRRFKINQNKTEICSLLLSIIFTSQKSTLCDFQNDLKWPQITLMWSDYRLSHVWDSLWTISCGMISLSKNFESRCLKLPW